MRGRKRTPAIFISLIMLFLLPDNLFAIQERGGREDIPGPTKPKDVRPAGTPSEPRAKVSPRVPKTGPALLADLTISVIPSDARLWLNNQETEYRERDGSLRLTGLKPGPITITIKKSNYLDYNRTIILEPEKSQFVDVVLVPILGRINVTPSLAGATITVTNQENQKVVGSYSEKVSDLEVPVGRYQIKVAKTDYQEVLRDVEVKSAETVYLEPQLEPLPVEKPAARRFSPMSFQSFHEGKNVVVSLTGASGDASAGRGTVEVSLVDGRSGAGTVIGTLPGVPCQVDFVRLENVGEYSFGESPGLSNGWARVVVRVRPKDSKRPVRFAINWSSVQGPSTAGGATGGAQLTEDAVPLQKILPNYPPAARGVRMSGEVLVKVEIDEQGDVVSAKAVEGPNLLRAAAETAARQWKFRPARRDGRPARAVQTIQFNFNPQF